MGSDCPEHVNQPYQSGVTPVPRWLHEELQQRELAKPAQVTSYTVDEWRAKLDRELPAKGYVKTETGWEWRPSQKGRWT